MFRSFLSTMQSFVADQRGQTFVEYVLLLVGVSVALLAALGPLDEAITGVFTVISDAF